MKRLLAVLALTSLAAACGGDDKAANDVADTSTDTAPVDTTPGSEPVNDIDPNSVRVFTSAEVCELVGPVVGSETLGVELTAITPSEASTPQCSYEFTTADGTFTNLTLAVQRPLDDLAGFAGQAGFDYTTSLVIFDTPYEPLDGLGDEAAVSASETFTMIAVLAGDQVFTIATGAPIDVANLVAFGNEVVANLGAADGTTDSPSDTPITDPNELAQAKVQAGLDTLPVDWIGTIASDLGEESDEGDDIVFAPCLNPGEYNLDNLDADSAASWELDAEGPATDSPFGGTQASLEARVFASDAAANDAYAVLERILGSDDGRECLAAAAPGQLAADAPEGTTFESRVEGTTIEGADVGARLIITFNTAGVVGEIYVDIVAAQFGSNCTIFATFTSFGAPVDQAVASAMFVAAVAAG